MKKHWLFLVLLVVVVVFGALYAENDKKAEVEKMVEEEKKPEVKMQTECPVMGGKINRDLFVDHDGKRIYLCCKGCVDTVKNAPVKYIKKLEDTGITLEKSPVELCRKCGEVKAGDKCCKDGVTKCDKCGLDKGSPGCCRITKNAKEPVMQCPECKEIMGTNKCCMTKKADEDEMVNRETKTEE
jgi:hypothetical protein